MGLTKTELFTDRQNRISDIAKSLAHPARIAIIDYLVQADQCINSDLQHELGLAQATVSQHLKELKTMGIIKGTVEGTSMCYCIDGGAWQQIQADLDSLFNKINQSCC
ncbi:MAG: winged helix-turn-helix transcriptional regulator [Flavobacteriales bacterium]|jgi:DNA-binding transcriptional ArsR family regulator|nr:winged helix-turn-helix transcriptional regulator [Flavobacteriales bacterium]NCG29435.1 metalloregulator ArsR/SmtB family transcription factor [Bacteroidota bacterium]MBT3963114.1 winged helix-turn-helix transcriptional regulator [Flavobacteriales bacterium]MBT4706064.1 winged helix-turn-helix transcriptional regulator [Flavobacteriales bacterium]MBT4930689.1 winged helix-turn-helix transcriptional regulator [Flavobacteriales bacterium]